MLRRHHSFFQSLLLIRDAVGALGAFAIAYILRFYSGLVPSAGDANPDSTLFTALLVALLWPCVAWYTDLYKSQRSRSNINYLFGVFRVSIVALMLLVTFTYFFGDERYSRVTLIMWGAAVFIVNGLGGTLSMSALRKLRRRGYNLRHVIIIGSGPLAQQVLDTIHAETTLGMRVLGVVVRNDDQHLLATTVGDIPVLGKVSDLSALLARYDIDQVIIALTIERLAALKNIMEILSLETVDVRVIPDFYQYATLCGSIEEFAGLPIINMQSSPMSGWNQVAKRLFDMIFSALGLLFISPLLALLAVIVKLGSDGPIFFLQQRVGMDGRSFNMYKFRTMRVDAEASGAQMTAVNDPRRTAIGEFLRRFSLDELPQLWNVFMGDMSLVGPRPEQPAFIEEFKKEIPRYALRHKIKAGMTGWAQVNGMRGNTSIRKRIELDLYYIENWSITLDLRILLRTVFGGFISPNAY